MTRVDVKELDAEMNNAEEFNKVLYLTNEDGTRKQLLNLGNDAKWQVTYNDGTKITKDTTPYKNLKREGVKSIEVIDSKGNVLHSVAVKNDKFIIRLISMVRSAMVGGVNLPVGEIQIIRDAILNEQKHPERIAALDPAKVKQVRENLRLIHLGFDNPKRCFLLATEGEHDYVWDDGDIDELTEWGHHTPYTKEKIGVLVPGEPDL